MNPNCDNFIERIPAYHEGKLPDADRDALRAHLEGCADCREIAESLRLLHGAMEMSPLPEKLDAHRVAAIAERFRSVKQKAAKPNPVAAIFARLPKIFAAPRRPKRDEELGWMIIFTRIIPFVALPALMLSAFLMLMMGGGANPRSHRMLARIAEGKEMDFVALGAAAPESSTTPTSGKYGKGESHGWAFAERFKNEMPAAEQPVIADARIETESSRKQLTDGRDRVAVARAESKPASDDYTVANPAPAEVAGGRYFYRSSPAPLAQRGGDVKSEISNFKSPTPARPALKPNAVAATRPPPPPAMPTPVTRTISGVVSDPQSVALGEAVDAPAATANYFAYTANADSTRLWDLQKGGSVVGGGLSSDASGPAATAPGKPQGLGLVVSSGNVTVPATPATATEYSGFLAERDVNGRFDDRRGTVAAGTVAAPSPMKGDKPARTGSVAPPAPQGSAEIAYTFQAGQAQPLAVNSTLDGGKLSAVTKSGSGTLSIDGVNTFSGGTLVNGGTLALTGESDASDRGVVELASAVKEVDQKLGRDVGGVDLFFDQSEAKKEVAKEKAVEEFAQQDRWFGTAEARRSGGTSGAFGGGGAGGGGIAGAKTGGMERDREKVSELSNREQRDNGLVAGKQLALGDYDADGDVRLEGRVMEKKMDQLALNKSAPEGEKLAEVRDQLRSRQLATGERLSDRAAGEASVQQNEILSKNANGYARVDIPADAERRRQLEVADGRAKQNSGGAFIGMESGAPGGGDAFDKLLDEIGGGARANRSVGDKVAQLQTAADDASVRMENGVTELQREDIKSFFSKAGVPFPKGSSISYRPESSEIVVVNSPNNLEKLENTLAYLNNSDAPAQPSVESLQPKPTQQELELQARLEKAIIPEINFRQGKIEDVLETIQKQIIGADPRKKDLKIETRGLSDHANTTTESLSSIPSITLNLRRVSGLNAIKYISEVAGLQYRFEGEKIVVAPANVLLDPVVSKTYKVSSSVFDTTIKTAPEPVRPAPPRAPAGFNPYIESAADAFSTFSIDVDTASFTLTRRAIEEGRLPDAEQVRTEEIVNAFDYDYAAPANGAFAMHAELAPSPFRAPLELLKVGIQGRLPGRDAKKAAVLTLVIDTSGSMDTADRLGRIRTSLKMLAGKLQPQDSIAIVAFNTEARLLLDRTAGADKARILAAIDSLTPSGSTQLEGGMRLAYEVAARGFVSGAANRVILMSDGVANLGAATAQEILASVAQFRAQGIYLTVLGFGSGNYDDAMLMQLADKGDGMYAFVDSDEEARRLLVDQWEQTLHVIAKDVKIQIEFNPDRVARWRQIGYEKRQLTKQDFRNDAVDAGEVGSGQAVTALYDIELKGDAGILPAGRLNGQDARFTMPIATMRVRYKDPDTGKVTELEQRITDGNRRANFANAPARFRIAACASEFAELLRVSPYTAGSDFDAVIEQLRPAASQLPLDQRVQELLRMAERARNLAQ